MNQAIRVRDLFDVPERVHQGDFVLKLTEGLQNPEETASLYVATPALVDAFDQALGLIGDALNSGRSKATYLHGSFGSGKSHFMAMLSLLLAGHPAAWRLPELHELRETHPFAGKHRLLELHCHMIGAETLEARLFSAYFAHLEKHHPEAPLPGLFADEALFEDARTTLARVGAEKFFGEMGGARQGWGKHGAAWTLESFEAHASSSDPRQRELLASALIKSWFGSYAKQASYVDIDTGLAVLSRHASELGYAGVVLFLDELILWLSHRASERSWLNRETEKMIKLVEAQESERPIPVVSFVARQRSLEDMVGKMHTGADEKILNDLLDHAKGRFDTLKLEDNNLPAIVEKRVLRPKGEAGINQLDAAFAALEKSAGDAWATLLGGEKPAAFRKLYPFSPALVEALVALSTSLQRQRTAIKLLVELLAEHIDDLPFGEVVRVGDLYDVLAGGEEPTDGVMRSLFRSAKQLYDYQFLPVLQETHGTTTAERCQRQRPEHPRRLGCSGCPEQQCRADNRLVKTLLIAALVPEVKVLRDLTVSRLFQLNHGSLRVPVPAMAGPIVTGKLKQWGAQNLPLFIGPEKDPAVHVRLEGVDLRPILQRYAGEDNSGSRQRVLRDLLFDALGLDRVADSGKQESTTWNATKRHGRILVGNVRSLSAEHLRCPPGEDFRLVLDYPFDEPGKTPNDDLNALERFMDQESSWTLVWLPHFFSDAANRMVGELAILEHIFSHSDVRRQAVSHLGTDDQARALTDMDNQRNQKKNRLLEVLAQAYGLHTAKDADISLDYRVDQHLVVLRRGASNIRPNLAPNLASAKEAFVHALLEQRYPNHPLFSHQLTPQRLARLQGRFAELLAAEDSRLPVEREEAHELAGTLGALGLVRVTEGNAHLVPDRMLQALENRRLAEGLDRPTVAEVRHWIDPNQLMGLQEPTQDLVVWCYAQWAKRTFDQNGKPFEPVAGRPLPAHATLEKPDLPEPIEWAQAVDKARTCLRITFAGRFLSPQNLMRLHAVLSERLAHFRGPAAALPAQLERRGALFGLGPGTDRARTARSADALCTLLSGKSPVDQVRALAAFEPETSASALGRHLDTAASVKALLDDGLVFGTFEQLHAAATTSEAAELTEAARSVLEQDEIHVSLEGRLRSLALRGQEVLRPPIAVMGHGVLGAAVGSGRGSGANTAEPAPPSNEAAPGSGVVASDELVRVNGRPAIEQALEQLKRQVLAAADAAGDSGAVELTLRWSLRRGG
jgi:hypothetical protein